MRWRVGRSSSPPVGGLQKRATIEARGTYDEVAGVIRFTETYKFDDDHVDTVNWMIRKVADGEYEGEEPTVHEKARGAQVGCAFHWSYTRDTPQRRVGYQAEFRRLVLYGR